MELRLTSDALDAVAYSKDVTETLINLLGRATALERAIDEHNERYAKHCMPNCCAPEDNVDPPEVMCAGCPKQWHINKDVYVEPSSLTKDPVKKPVVPNNEFVQHQESTNATIGWGDWLTALNALFVATGHAALDEKVSDSTGENCWRECYDDGYTPREAILEELSND